MSPRNLLILTLTLGLVLWNALPSAAQSDDNPRVSQVENQFNWFKPYGEIMGFYIGTTPDPTLYKHWQGIQRSAGTGTPYLFVSRNGENAAGKYANLAIVEMASRNKNGGRMRSNRLTNTSKPYDTAPPAMDKVVANIEFSSATPAVNYNHAGGIQRIGNILAVPLEERNDSSLPQGRIVFYDVTNPRSPVRLSATIDSTSHNFGVVGICRLPNDGRYLILATYGNNRLIEFWRSNTTSLRDSNLSFTLIDTVNYEDVPNWKDQYEVFGEPAGGTYQSINFIVQTDGTLYLLCARNTYASGGQWDRMQLFKVTLSGDNVTITEAVGERTMNTRDSGNFIAGGGVHITPSGELLFYACEHDNDGPNSCVKMTEFSRIWGSQEDQFGGAAWVNFFENTGFTGRDLMFDSRDRPYQNWEDFDDVDSFGDKTSSLVWYAPVGTTIRLYKNPNGGGDFKDLVGTGRVETVYSVNDWGSWNDRIDSARIILGDPGPTLIAPTPRFPTFESAWTQLGLEVGKPYNRFQLGSANYNQQRLFTVNTLVEALGGAVVIGAP